MRRSIKLRIVLIALVSLCLVFASCDSDAPTPPPVPTYTISFIAGEGTGSMEPVTVENGASYQVPACAFTAPSGKEFKCWNDGTADINVGETIVVGSNITLYAKWTVIPTHIISFDAGEGTGSMAPVTVEKGTSYAIPANGFMEPYGTLRKFAGWNTLADGSGTEYSAGATIPAVTADITLYAQWAKPYFSVSATEKVYFAKGNLYWDGSSFKMEEKQYNTTPASDGTWDSSHVSHFYWSKIANVAYAQGYYDSGADSDTFFAADGGAISGWDVLSEGEWNYLFNTREGAASKVGYGTVCGVNGIILLPDVFTDPMKNNGSGAFKPKATIGYDANIYTSDDWDAMEAAGAVFLPAAGCRDGSGVGGVGYYGYYWSATPDGSGYAYGLYFNGSGMRPDYSDVRVDGYAVRLVVAEN